MLALAACACASAACDSATYIEGRVDWRSDDEIYRVQYVTPPWEVDSDDGVELRLSIAAELFGAALQGSPPTHVFVLGPVDAEVAIETFLPSTLALDPADIADAIDMADGTGGELPLPLAGIDLGRPRDVALAELNHLVEERAADLRRELALDETSGAWRYDVVVPPGMLVRGLYYDDGDRTIRALFASLFDITDGDVERMGSTIRVESGGVP
jgi:hypothetical protein